MEIKFRKISPICPHFGVCGGCQLMDLSYKDQLEFKQTQFVKKMSGIKSEILPIIPGSDEIYFYRNSIRFFFIHNEDGSIAFARDGLNTKHNPIEVNGCFLMSEITNLILQRLKSALNETDIPKKTLWQIKFREGKFTGDIMVEIVTTSEELPAEDIIKQTLTGISAVKSIYHISLKGKSLKNMKRRLIFGLPVIYEKIGPYRFQISPESFFQTNSLGVKTLYDTIKSFADIKMGDFVFDLYSGTGTIAIYLATMPKKVIGIETEARAVNDAIDNAKLNKVHNVEFICDDVENYLTINKSGFKNTTIIVDPPRAGLSRNVIKLLSDKIIGKLIYISCNPDTFVRDIKLFHKEGINLLKVQPIDMFPHINHLEVVGLLKAA